MANKLELTWYGKEQEISVEPRLLIERPELSNTDDDPDAENMLIHGDNLLALKALESKYAGQVKCIYIDPPYNTGSAFEHYDDNLEHSQWLSLMRPRLEILLNLLSDDGSIWISIDDDEGHYLKVLCDEIFGRQNFVSTVIWEKKYSPQNDAKWLSDSHDFILVYAKDKATWRPNLLPRTAEMNARYKNVDNDPRGPWKAGDCSVKTYNANCDYPITTPSGRVVNPPAGYCWRFSKETFAEMVKDNRIWFGADGNNVPAVKRFLTDVKQGMTSMTIWKYTEVGHNQDAKKEVKVFNSESVFATPKPERLIERVLTLGSNEGDLVLDSFLGSGTTAAVAHKMGRKYIGIEMGEHAYTHCKKRLDMVVSGEDKGGISKAVKWENGGGYRFYELAPTLINKDEFGEFIINPDYSADMLAAAMALHEGFTYEPDSSAFWKQSHGNEKSYLFVTTRHLNAAFMDSIIGGMEDDEYLVIACCSYDKEVEKMNPHITVKKIPQMLLSRCEFDKADYSLNIIHPPVYDDEEECDDEG
ncbi:site-specific DNA-methyltransferase [Ruminococcus sp.]|uniref:site-specific DNA-methyltransferase n=1 Tax=Ruminococcus sp. TaxID=41978 RepID=UPI0025FDE2C6|nr:site-specific DNA-methyltransferase [Ruminococcus sp.]MBR1432225.1 site-specific DNA-methyltransferase [Ruminococcus sp.]